MANNASATIANLDTVMDEQTNIPDAINIALSANPLNPAANPFLGTNAAPSRPARARSEPPPAAPSAIPSNGLADVNMEFPEQAPPPLFTANALLATKARRYNFPIACPDDEAVARWINRYLDDARHNPLQHERRLQWAMEWGKQFRHNRSMYRFLERTPPPLAPLLTDQRMGQYFPWDEELFMEYRIALKKVMWEVNHESDTESEFVYTSSSENEEDSRSRRPQARMSTPTEKIQRPFYARPAPKFPDPVDSPPEAPAQSSLLNWEPTGPTDTDKRILSPSDVPQRERRAPLSASRALFSGSDGEFTFRLGMPAPPGSFREPVCTAAPILSGPSSPSSPAVHSPVSRLSLLGSGARASGLASDIASLRAKIARLEQASLGSRQTDRIAPRNSSPALPPAPVVAPASVGPSVGTHGTEAQPSGGSVDMFLAQFKLHPPEKWADPSPLTAEPRKAVDWLESFLRYYRLTTGSLVGVSDALWFCLKSPSAQAWLTAQFQEISASAMDASDASLLRALFVARYAPETRDRSVEAYERLCRGKVRQRGDLESYIAEFEEEIRYVRPPLAPAAQCQFFIAGLDKSLQSDCQMDLTGADWVSLPDLLRFARALAKKALDRIASAPSFPPRRLYDGQQGRFAQREEQPRRGQQQGNGANRPYFSNQGQGRPREALTMLGVRKERSSPGDQPAPTRQRPAAGLPMGYGITIDAQGSVHIGPPDLNSRRWCVCCRGLAERAGAAPGHTEQQCPWARLSERELKGMMRRFFH